MRNDEAGHPRVVAQSIFVAHKSRSPYGPPSAKPHLHGSSHIRGSPQVSSSRGGTFEAASAVVPGSLSGLPATGNGTCATLGPTTALLGWTRSTRPLPTTLISTAADAKDGKPKLRDVFANRDDDDWTDDEERVVLGRVGPARLVVGSKRDGWVVALRHTHRLFPSSSTVFRAATPA